MVDSTAPEYASIEAFVEYCMEEDCDRYNHVALQELACSVQLSCHKVRKELEGYGLTLMYREKEQEVRGFGSNDHDRWYGKGADRSYGGSGHEQIAGFAGQEG